MAPRVRFGAMKKATTLARIRHFTLVAGIALVRMQPVSAAAPTGALATQIGLPRISSGFGMRTDPLRARPAMHRGVDIPGAPGTPVLAAAAGVVRFAGWRGDFGNLVELRHDGGGLTRYGHLAAILVHRGDRVARGVVIARMGSTGRSTGSHLHFEYWPDGRPVDPLPYLGGLRAGYFSATTPVAANREGSQINVRPYQSAFARDWSVDRTFDSVSLPGGGAPTP